MRKWIILLCLLSFVSLSYATDFCAHLPGLWFGSFTYKNIDDCRKAGACRQLLTGELKKLAENEYEVELAPPVYQYRIVRFRCENNQIKLNINTAHEIDFDCQDSCRIVYNDDRIVSLLTQIK